VAAIVRAKPSAGCQHCAQMCAAVSDRFPKMGCRRLARPEKNALHPVSFQLSVKQGGPAFPHHGWCLPPSTC